jgi:DNA invertase Pin-like site-specific DNA recombinase
VRGDRGKRADRPELANALAACKKQKAKLVIAKLDRLSRNLAFIAALMESGVEFVAVDNPHATKLTVHILAAVAEHEREMISERTKAALAAAKARGKVLGSKNIAEVGKLGAAAVKANARRFAANVRPIIKEIMRAGATSHNAIAQKLNERNVKTARGGRWTHVQVGAILHPFAAAAVGEASALSWCAHEPPTLAARDQRVNPHAHKLMRMVSPELAEADIRVVKSHSGYDPNRKSSGRFCCAAQQSAAPSMAPACDGGDKSSSATCRLSFLLTEKTTQRIKCEYRTAAGGRRPD